MGKLSKKLAIYLDQNFISEMAKSDVNELVNLRFKNIYELLHNAVLEEKVFVPASLFHDIESSLAPDLKEKISKYQAYLGQVDLNNQDTILTFQAVEAAKRFLGEEVQESSYSIAYQSDPDSLLESPSGTINVL